ncbi:MAG: single-stranded-DNA-specific exonuclease RecJ [Pirellulaceae bacterium]|jgi:single-stranded-DNA-specific exonuclease|nr:single-stranded-DNA-specific exonuclease RecJ [Pirellulaceae bacterium]MDP7014588.1 single-stranded-DNA-specific exonuclease RecJ [Pirellulaceae bacterium]
MGKRWRLYPHDAERVKQLERSARVSPVVAQLLLARGVTDPTDVQDFLQARLNGLRDPDLLPGMTDAADRVFAAIRDKRRIMIYGDYDADGMTGASILVLCIQVLGGNVGYYTPNRLEEGYGLNEDALRTLRERGAELVISVDCGIGSIHEAAVAKEIGLELIVTDHHELADELPAAAAITHPRLPGTAYPFGGLCGAGVAFKMAWALCQRASEAKKVTDRLRNFLVSAMGIAAIGTVADVVPLIDENRLLVRHGLVSLREKPGIGLQELLRVTKLSEKAQLASEDIAFMIAPRLNAAGRLGQAQLGVELLTTPSRERAAALAEYIHELNKSRDSLERSIYTQALKQAKERFEPENDPALVLAGAGWHTGVIGIVAGRLAEKFNVPVIVIGLDQTGVKPGTGSARSASGFNLYEGLQACSHHLAGFGGHAAAAGMKIEESKIDAFRDDFYEQAAAEITDEARVPEIRIDAESPISQLNVHIVSLIDQLAPFGEANPRPVLCATGVEIVGEPKKMGGGDRHLSLRLKQHGKALRALAFGHGDWADELAQLEGPIDIAYRPVINEYRGFRSVEMHLVDWRPGESAESAETVAGGASKAAPPS